MRINAPAAALAAHEKLNDTLADYPEEPIGDIFARQVAERPDQAAIRCGEHTLTYSELNRAATQLAKALLQDGAQPGEAIAVALPRSPEMVTAALGILLCGASYLPIDLRWPERRIASLLDVAGVRRIVAAAAEPPQMFGRTVIDAAVTPISGATPDLPSVSPDAIAYILFTSGSTGQPKGVLIRHRGVARLVFACRYAPLGPDVRVLHQSPVTFDAAVFEIWAPLLRGGVCVIHPDPFVRLARLRRTVAAHRPDVVLVITALFNTIVDDAPEILDQVGTILVAGEAHSVRHTRRALLRYGPARIVNAYGPTEATVFATYHPVDELPAEASSVPIGTPIQNTRAYLFDNDRLCKPGQLGTLHLAGPGVGLGYLGLPERTAASFIEARIGTQHERLYCTGDLARLDTQGRLVFCGRHDDQVKINGYRVECSEVRHRIEEIPGVRAAHVMLYEPSLGQRALAAFIVPDCSDVSPQLVTFVRAYLKANLPAYMVPKTLSVVAELPLRESGKIDSAALLTSMGNPT